MNVDNFRAAPLLARAIAIAVDAHLFHMDKAGAPYILHPLRVMCSLGKASEEQQIIAVLHDVVEDSSWTLEDLAREFSAEVVLAIDCLTRRKGESYENYIRRVSSNNLAVRVKLEDLRDNANLARFDQPTEADVLRAKKYRETIKQFYRLVGITQ